MGLMKSLYDQLTAKNIKPIALAAALEVDRATVSRWNKRKVPAERVRSVAGVTGIPAHDLRPDLFVKSGPTA